MSEKVKFAAVMALLVGVAAIAAPSTLELKPWKASSGGSVTKDLTKLAGHLRAQAPVREKQEPFSVDCPLSSKEIFMLIAGQPVTHEFKFEKWCDLQGTVVISQEPFPVSVEVRHLGSFTHLDMTAQIEASPYGKKLLNYQIAWSSKTAELKSPELKAPFRFAMDYKVIVNVAAGGATESKGGQIRVR